MDASQLAIIIGAMFTGFSALIAAAFKGYSLTQKVEKKVDHSDYGQSKQIEELRKTLVLEMSKVQNEVSLITAKLVWTESAPEKTKKVMDSALEKMRHMNETQKEWITSEIVRVKGGDNG